MLLKRIKFLSIFLIAGIIFGSLTPSVFAAYTSSNWSSGYGTKGFASLDDSSPMTAGALVQTTNGSSLDVGYLGAKPILYKNGVVVRQGSYTYNKSVSSYANASMTINSGSGDYQTEAIFAVWQSGTSKYEYYGSSKTPIIQH
ncbi:hypothetical protein MHB71_13080 [Paenibacillus sp. FSL H7-0940]|uniref:hypothetical protein n=1 Tax=Paenibacillus sp. FSL H7-0940 TaxID=2921443 RepID=UPI0030EBB055